MVVVVCGVGWGGRWGTVYFIMFLANCDGLKLVC